MRRGVPAGTALGHPQARASEEMDRFMSGSHPQILPHHRPPDAAGRAGTPDGSKGQNVFVVTR